MKKRILGVLFSFALMLTMMPVLGLSQTVYAGGFPDAQILPDQNAGTATKQEGVESCIYSATPKSGYVFDHWEYKDGFGTKSSRINPLTLPQGNYTEVKAVFGEPYPLWVGGTQVTSANKDDIPATGGTKSGTASYDVETNTLTLNGYTYSGKGYTERDDWYGILYADEAVIGGKLLTIVLEGENSITCTGGPDDYCYGIVTSGSLTFKGTGNLDVSSNYFGIRANNGDINIEGSGDITAVGTEKGISVYRDMTIGENAGTITASASGKESTGLWVNGSGGLAVNGGSVHVGASGEGSVGVKVSYSNAKLTIGEKTKSFISSGTLTAVHGSVVNAITGTGWSDPEGTKGKADIVISASGQDISSYKKVQFPAVPEPVKESTITYDLNGGTWDGKTGIVTQTVNNGTVITLPAPTRDGYTFDYWEGSKYYAGDKYKVNGDHTFKAVWKTADKGGSSDSDNKGGSSKKGVKTGDEQNVAGWITMMIASVLAMAALAVKRKDILHR